MKMRVIDMSEVDIKNIYYEILSYYKSTEEGLRLLAMNIKFDMIDLSPDFPYYSDGIRSVRLLEESDTNLEFEIYCDLIFYDCIYNKLKQYPSSYHHSRVHIFIVSNNFNLKCLPVVVETSSNLKTSEIVNVTLLTDMSNVLLVGVNDNNESVLDKIITFNYTFNEMKCTYSPFDLYNLKEYGINFNIGSYILGLTLYNESDFSNIDKYVSILNNGILNYGRNGDGVCLFKNKYKAKTGIHFRLNLINFDYDFVFQFVE